MWYIGSSTGPPRSKFAIVMPIGMLVSTRAAVSQWNVRATMEYPGPSAAAMSRPIKAPASADERRCIFDRFRRLGQRRNHMVELMAGARRFRREIAAIVDVDRCLERHAAGNFNSGLD